MDVGERKDEDAFYKNPLKSVSDASGSVINIGNGEFSGRGTFSVNPPKKIIGKKSFYSREICKRR